MQIVSPNESICMKFQSLFSGKNKKNIINLLSAEFAQIVVKDNELRNSLPFFRVNVTFFHIQFQLFVFATSQFQRLQHKHLPTYNAYGVVNN